MGDVEVTGGYCDKVSQNAPWSCLLCVAGGRSERESSLVGGPSVVLVVATSVDVDTRIAKSSLKVARAET